MQITLEIPEQTREEDWLREIALALFAEGLISLNRASSIAKMHPINFQKLMGDRGICVHYDIEDFEEDIAHLEKKGWL